MQESGVFSVEISLETEFGSNLGYLGICKIGDEGCKHLSRA